MAMNVKKIFDASVYVNDKSKHGQASEVTCPDVSFVMNEYNALGMIGQVKLFNGIEAMEMSVKWQHIDNDAQIALANPLKAVDITIFSSRAGYDNSGHTEEKKIAMYVRGFSTKHQGGSYKPREDSEFESTIAVFYYKLEVDGEEILEIDVMNNIFTVNGVDMLEERKSNLGI